MQGYCKFLLLLLPFFEIHWEYEQKILDWEFTEHFDASVIENIENFSGWLPYVDKRILDDSFQTNPIYQGVFFVPLYVLDILARRNDLVPAPPNIPPIRFPLEFL